MTSENRKGAAARVKSWVQSLWLHPDGSICQECLVISVAALVFAALFAMIRANIILIAETLAAGLTIASLVKAAQWRERKLRIARDVLLQVAFEKCRCDPNAIITECPMEPEMIGKPVGSRGHCSVCGARAVLREEFPGEIQQRVREFTLQGLPVPDEIVSCLTPSQSIILQDELASGWKVPLGPGWGERR
jgi:hypothetical protein